MGTPVDVQETVILKYRNEKDWRVETSDATFITLMKNQGYSPAEKAGGYHLYVLPENRLTIRKSAPRKRKKVTEATRKKLAKNLEKARAARKGK